MTRFLVLLLLPLFSATAADLHRYELPRLAPSASECEVQRARIDAAFTKQGVTVFDSQCKLSGKHFGLTLTYVADKPLDIISTMERYPHMVRTAFRHEADCLRDLELEVRNFKDQTRLEPLVAYCSPDTFPSFFSEFYVRVDALGSPLNRPFTFERMVLPRLKGKIAQLTAELMGAKSDRLNVSRVRFFNELGGHHVSLHYYAPARVCLGLEKLMSFSEPDGCDKYGAALKAITATSSDAPLGLVCGPWDRGAEAYVLGARDRVTMRSEAAPQSFVSLSACDSKKAELEQFYKSTLKRKILGSLCHLNKDQTATLSLIEERTAPKECY